MFDVAVAELRQSDAFGRVVLADVLDEAVHGRMPPVDQRAEPAAGTDGGQLPVIAHHDHFRLGVVGGDEETVEVGVVGHAGLVQDHDGGVVECQLVVVDAPQQRRQRPRRNLRRLLQGAGGLPGGGRPDDGVSGGGVGVAERGQRGGLAGTGDAQHQLDPVAGGAHVLHQRPLPGGQLRVQGLLTTLDRLLHAMGGDGGGVGAVHAPGDGLGDGLLDGEHGRQRVDPFAAPRRVNNGTSSRWA